MANIFGGGMPRMRPRIPHKAMREGRHVWSHHFDADFEMQEQ